MTTDITRQDDGQATAISRPEQLKRTYMSGPLRSVDQLRQAMESFQAAGVDVLIPPKTAIPAGYGIALSLIVPRESDLYPVPGQKDKVALGKNALNQLAAAAGVRWDPELSRRMDDGSDPHYCHYKAVGVLEDTDGSTRPFSDEKVVDMRLGSAQVSSIIRGATRYWSKDYNPEWGPVEPMGEPEPTVAAVRKWRAQIADYNAKAEKAGQYKRKLRDPFEQVDEIRAHIMSHAITKAKNRALRSVLGVPVAMPASEARAFLVAKPTFIGDFGDPAINARVAEQITAHALGAKAALFGGRALPQPAPVPEQPALMAPPPINRSAAENVEQLDDSWDGPSAEWSPPPAPPPKRSLTEMVASAPHSERVALLCQAAKRKGAYGAGDGQFSERDAQAWDEATMQAAAAKLEAMADVNSDDTDWQPPADDVVPF